MATASVHAQHGVSRQIEGVTFRAFHSTIHDHSDFISGIGLSVQGIDDTFTGKVFPAIPDGAYAFDGHAISPVHNRSRHRFPFERGKFAVLIRGQGISVADDGLGVLFIIPETVHAQDSVAGKVEGIGGCD